MRARRRFTTGACREFIASTNPGAFLVQNWTIQIPSNPCHLSLPTESLAQSPVTSTLFRSQAASMVDVTTVILLEAAGAPFIQESLGRHAATLSSSTKLIYIFFAVGSTCLLPASALLSPPFAPTRRAHPATGRHALSPLSPGAARRRGGHHALKVGAVEHLPAEHLRAMPAASLGQKNRRLRPWEAAAWRCWRFLVASVRSFEGYFSRGAPSRRGRMGTNFFYCTNR